MAKSSCSSAASAAINLCDQLCAGANRRRVVNAGFRRQPKALYRLSSLSLQRTRRHPDASGLKGGLTRWANLRQPGRDQRARPQWPLWRNAARREIRFEKVLSTEKMSVCKSLTPITLSDHFFTDFDLSDLAIAPTSRPRDLLGEIAGCLNEAATSLADPDDEVQLLFANELTHCPWFL